MEGPAHSQWAGKREEGEGEGEEGAVVGGRGQEEGEGVEVGEAGGLTYVPFVCSKNRT